MGNVKKKKIFKLNSNGYLVLITSILITLSLTIYFFALSQNETKTINTTENGKIDYQVCVKNNDYYPEKCLDKGMQYIANLIDYINVKFNYELSSDEKVNYNYKYHIDAEVNVFAKNDPNNIIYTNTKNLVKEKTASINNKNLLKIDDNIQIKYNEYNEKVRSFKNEYGVNADSNIKIKIYVTPTIKYSEFESDIQKEEVMMVLSIPLTEKQINITAIANDIKNIKEYKEDGTINYIYLGCGILAGILMIFSLIILSFDLINKSRNKTPYQKEIDRILREYDYIISESETIIDPDETEYEYTDLKSFKDLKEMAVNIDKQIIFSELKELKRPRRSWFYIINDDAKRIYRFVIDSNEERFKV